MTPLLHTDPLSGGLWQAVLSEPLVLASLLLAGWCHARGTLQIWRHVGHGRVVSPWQARAWWLGLVALAVALVSPLEALAGSLFSAHMVQHVLLTTIAAPLLVLARPTLPLLQGVPHRARRQAVRLREQARPVDRATYALAWPLVVAAGYSGVTWLWHLPGPYQAALRSDAVHAVEHVTLLGAAVMLWWVVRESGQRSQFGYGAGIMVVFVVGLAHSALGAVLTFAPHVLYAHYAVTAEAWGIGAMHDQNLAGVAMWAPGKLVHGVAVVVLVIAWLRATEKRAQTREA